MEKGSRQRELPTMRVSAACSGNLRKESGVSKVKEKSRKIARMYQRENG
jgi:hypothetical protein